MALSPELLQVERFVELSIEIATYNSKPEETPEWNNLRSELLGDNKLKAQLPEFVQRYSTPQAFRAAMQRLGGYAERRQFIWDEFGNLVKKLESSSARPADEAIGDILKTINSDTVHAYWEHALVRRESDFEGAITLARTLLETVFKYILHAAGVTIDDRWSLQRLYLETANVVRLAPNQQQDQHFQQIYQDVVSIITQLGSIRNSLGDSHGKSPASSPAERRHAEFAVNLAGTVASFIVSAWQSQNRSD